MSNRNSELTTILAAEFDSTTGATSVDMAKDLVAVTQAIQQRGMI